MDGDQRVGPDSVPVRSLRVAARNIAGEIVLSTPDWDEQVALPDTAGFLWRNMDGRRSVRALGELLSERYAVDVETAIADAADVVAELAGLQLLTVTPAPGR